MSDPMVSPIEDLVKTAIKEAIAKRGKIVVGPEGTKVEDIPPVIETPVIKEVTLKARQILASSLFKGTFRIEAPEDFGVTIFSPEEFDPKIREFIPSVTSTYALDKSNTLDILRGWETKDKTLLYGPTAAGKSSLVKELCAWTGRPFVRLNCTEDMDSSMIFGQQTASDGSTHWEDGVITEAVKYGAVFAWDEWDVTPPGIAMGLQWLLEEDGKLFLKEKPGTAKDKFITPDARFLLVALGNTQGQGDDTGSFSGTTPQNTATLDRFGTTLEIKYLKSEVEIKMLANRFPVMSISVIRNLVKCANLIRQAYTTGQLSITFSPRSTIGVCKKMSESGYSFARAVDLAYTNKLTETNRKVAKELIRKVIGEEKMDDIKE